MQVIEVSKNFSSKFVCFSIGILMGEIKHLGTEKQYFEYREKQKCWRFGSSDYEESDAKNKKKGF